MGFSGFEGRFYSLFERFGEDLGRATDLQTLITALAFKYMALGTVLPTSIPDTPSAESERRQVFFGTAVGLPTFFVHKDTHNTFLLKILAKTEGIRPSRRYPGYLRIPNNAYRLALLSVLREDAADLIEQMGLYETIQDLENRLRQFDTHAVAGRLTNAILDKSNSRSAMHHPAREFNLMAEDYYRNGLRHKQISEALNMLKTDQTNIQLAASELDTATKCALEAILVPTHDEATHRHQQALIAITPDIYDIRQFGNILLATVYGIDTIYRSHFDKTSVFRGEQCSISI